MVYFHILNQFHFTKTVRVNPVQSIAAVSEVFRLTFRKYKDW